jgi:hypothetical protein
MRSDCQDALRANAFQCRLSSGRLVSMSIGTSGIFDPLYRCGSALNASNARTMLGSASASYGRPNR